MSIIHVDPVVRKFVRGEHDSLGAGPGTSARTLALRGRWGVGKTFYWRQILGEERIAGRRYAYVSLFGLSSLDEVKGALVTALALDWLPDKTQGAAGRLVPHVASTAATLLEKVPYFGTVATAAGGTLARAFAFELVRDALICFDDLERRNEALDMRDILGFATQLRDERNCDIALILNDDQLDGHEGGTNGDAAAFAKHGEKAVDYQVRFAPTAGEAFKIVYPAEDGFEQEIVRECCERLDISNVRVLQRVRRAVEATALSLRRRERDTVDSAVRAVVLLTWGYYDRENAPEFARVRKPVNHFMSERRDRDNDDPEVKEWAETLGRYEYYPNSELYEVLADYVEKGYVDEEKLIHALTTLDSESATSEERLAYNSAWDIYKSSFEDNVSDFSNALVDVMISHHKNLNIAEFNADIWMLRKLSQDGPADELIAEYVLSFPDHGVRTWTEFEERLFDDYPLDPEFERQARENLIRPVPDHTLTSALADVSNRGPFEVGHAPFLAGRPVEEFAAYFRQARGSELSKAIRWCLAGAGGEHGTDRVIVSEKARSALSEVMRDSPLLNRLRLKGLYGFEPDSEDSSGEETTSSETSPTGETEP